MPSDESRRFQKILRERREEVRRQVESGERKRACSGCGRLDTGLGYCVYCNERNKHE
jgi:hypothetical protein